MAPAQGNVGGQRIRLCNAPEQGYNGFSACAVEHGWRALTFPLAPFLAHTGSGRGDVGG